jgi:glycosyltransferase involved in cell wall biosynthesis
VSVYYKPEVPSGANLRFEGLRQATTQLALDIAFIPHRDTIVQVELRRLFTCSQLMRRVASLLLQLGLRHHLAVFDSVPFLPFRRHFLLVHDCGNLFASIRRSGHLRSMFFRVQLKCVRNFVTVSRSTARMLRLCGYRAPSIVSPNAAGFLPAPAAAQRDIDFLFVSSGAHHKRDVPAYKAVRAAFPSARIVLAGHQLEEKLGPALDGRAEFVNSPSNSEVASLFVRSKVYVTWSRVEGFGMTVLEALASGCSCLVTNLPCFRELFWGYPQVALLPVEGLDAKHLTALLAATDQGRRPVPPRSGSWVDILCQLHSGLSASDGELHSSSPQGRTSC